MANVRGYRKVFVKAQKHMKLMKEKGPDAPRDVEMETLVGILLGKFLPHVHYYRADDMIAFLQVAEEFGFNVRSFHHGLEAYKIRDILATKDVSVSTWADCGDLRWKPMTVFPRTQRLSLRREASRHPF